MERRERSEEKGIREGIPVSLRYVNSIVPGQRKNKKKRKYMKKRNWG